MCSVFMDSCRYVGFFGVRLLVSSIFHVLKLQIRCLFWVTRIDFEDDGTYQLSNVKQVTTFVIICGVHIAFPGLQYQFSKLAWKHGHPEVIYSISIDEKGCLHQPSSGVLIPQNLSFPFIRCYLHCTTT